MSSLTSPTPRIPTCPAAMNGIAANSAEIAGSACGRPGDAAATPRDGERDDPGEHEHGEDDRQRRAAGAEAGGGPGGDEQHREADRAREPGPLAATAEASAAWPTASDPATISAAEAIAASTVPVLGG